MTPAQRRRQVQAERLRGKFETWMRRCHKGHTLDTTEYTLTGEFTYRSAGTQHKWLGFQAGHRSRVTELVDALSEMLLSYSLMSQHMPEGLARDSARGYFIGTPAKAERALNKFKELP